MRPIPAGTASRSSIYASPQALGCALLAQRAAGAALGGAWEVLGGLRCWAPSADAEG